MAKEKLKAWLIDDFTGGLSEGSKRGVKGSYRAGIGIDFRTDPDKLTANRKIKKDSDATVDELVKWMVESGTDLYMLGDGGDLYKRTSAGTYSLINDFTGSGQGMELFDDFIFVADDDGLHRYGPLSGTPAVETNFLLSPATEIDQKSGNIGGANVYTLTTAINEGATHRQTFTAGVTDITGVELNIVAKGTGDWTVLVHDASNVLVASVTIVNATLPTAGRTRFDFSGVNTIVSGNVYHIHAFSSVADGTIRSTTGADMEDCEYSTFTSYSTEDVDQELNITGTVNEVDTYTLTTAIDEGATHRQTFTPDRSNILDVAVLVNSEGTGNWTLTVHDSKDTEIATKTIANGSIDEAKGWFKFTFASVADLVVGATYHFHLTSTVADGSVFATTASDLETAGFRTHYQILQSDSDFHPMKYFPSGGTAGTMAIGNGNFVAIYDNILYREPGSGTGSERLKLAKEEKVRALELVGDYLAIGAWKGDSIGDHGSSRIYFWDGTSSSYNAFKDVPGEINAMLTADDGLMYVWAGGTGQIYVYSGALDLVQTIPAVGENKTIEIFPGAAANWEGLPRFGISGGDTTTAFRGIYSYGAKTKDYTRSMTSDYPISTGNSDSNVTIGALHGLGPAKFFVGWQDDTGGASYGVDIIDTVNDQASVTLETLIFDDKSPHWERRTSSIRLNFETLVSGQSITVAYQIDRSGSFTTLGSASFTADGGVVTKSLPFEKRFREIELKFTLATSVAAAPTLTSATLFFTEVPDEQGK